MLLYREEAFCTAVTNAKKKAESVSQTVGLCLGSVVTLAEVHQSEEADHRSSQGSLIEERRREGTCFPVFTLLFPAQNMC